MSWVLMRGAVGAVMVTVLATGCAGSDGGGSDGSATSSVSSSAAQPQSSATFAAGVPGAPSGVAGVAGPGVITVSWEAPGDSGSGVTGYRVFALDGQGQAAGACVAPGDSTSCAITDVTGGGMYTLVVRAESAAGLGPVSAPSEPITPG